MKRYAIVRGARTRREAEAYLPDGYRVLGELVEQRREFCSISPDGTILRDEKTVFVIGGSDHFGWTLDGYIIPRLASGSMGCEEIDLSHPAMKAIPVQPRASRSV